MGGASFSAHFALPLLFKQMMSQNILGLTFVALCFMFRGSFFSLSCEGAAESSAGSGFPGSILIFSIVELSVAYVLQLILVHPAGLTFTSSAVSWFLETRGPLSEACELLYSKSCLVDSYAATNVTVSSLECSNLRGASTDLTRGPSWTAMCFVYLHSTLFSTFLPAMGPFFDLLRISTAVRLSVQAVFLTYGSFSMCG